MSERQRFIRPAVKVPPRLIAEALRRVATALDAADDCRKVTFYAGMSDVHDRTAVTLAWGQTALLIADEYNVDSVALLKLAATIDKGEQYVLFT